MTPTQWAIIAALVAVAAAPLIIMRVAALISYGWARGKQHFQSDLTNKKRNRDNGSAE